MIYAEPIVEAGIQEVHLRKGDRLPGLLMKIVDDFREPVPLTGLRVYITLRRVEGVENITGTWLPLREIQIRDAAQGIVFYDVQDYDTAFNPGRFEVIVVLVDATTLERVLTVPTRREAYISMNSNVLVGDIVGGLLLTVNGGDQLTLNGKPASVEV